MCPPSASVGADHLPVPQPAAGQRHRHHDRPVVAAVGAALRAHLRRAAELAHRDHQHVVEQPALVEVADQRRDQVVEERQQRPQALADAAVGRDVVAVRVPGARGGVVAQVERDERDPGLDQPPGQQRLLAPEVLAVAVARRLAAPCDRSNASRTRPPVEHLHRLLAVLVHRLHRARTRRCRARSRSKSVSSARRSPHALVGQARRAARTVGRR